MTNEELNIRIKKAFKFIDLLASKQSAGQDTYSFGYLYKEDFENLINVLNFLKNRRIKIVY